MALQKEHIAPFGAPIKYWRIAKVSVDWINEIANIIVFGYLSAETRNSGLSPGTTKSFVFKPYQNFDNVKEPFQFSAKDPIMDRAYQLIKDEEFFKGSVNV